MKITRQFIAEKAGVSPTTVSEVLNRSPRARISAEVAEKVRAIADQYSYTPNYSARALVTGKTFNIGIAYSETIYESFEDPFRAAIMKGIERALDASNYNLLFISGKNENVPNNSFTRAVSARSVDGLIAFWPISDKALDMIEAKGIPYVIVDGIPEGRSSNCILPDNVSATYNATRHLIDSGCRDILFTYGRLAFHHITNIERPEGYSKAMKEANLPETIISTAPRISRAKDDLLKYFHEKGLPGAIMTAGDQMTLGAHEALLEFAPDALTKVRLIGFDDIPWLSERKPAISAIHVPIQEMGHESVRLLMKAINDPEQPKSITRMQTSLIIRET